MVYVGRWVGDMVSVMMSGWVTWCLWQGGWVGDMVSVMTEWVGDMVSVVAAWHNRSLG